MWFDIEPGSSIPIYLQLVNKIREAVARGILEPGDRMPTVRALASQLTTNPNTVAKAYQRLEQEGVIITLGSKGSFISGNWPGHSDEQGRRVIADLLDKLLVEAFHRGVNEKEFRELVEERLQNWEKERGSG